MRTWLTGILLGWAFAAGAASVTAFSPEGTAKGVRQASARFDAPMTALGDPRQADPFVVDCSVPGSGKWLDERTWVYDFERDLPGATRCVFVLREGLKDGRARRLRRAPSTSIPAARRCWRYGRGKAVPSTNARSFCSLSMRA